MSNLAPSLPQSETNVHRPALKSWRPPADYASPRARQIVDLLAVHDGLTPQQIICRLWGESYLAAPWQNTFHQHMHMARRHARQRGLVIVTQRPPHGVYSLRPAGEERVA